VVREQEIAMFPLSVNEVRTKLAEARYIVEEDTIRQVYLAGECKNPVRPRYSWYGRDAGQA
jgi:hypothetical protein